MKLAAVAVLCTTIALLAPGAAANAPLVYVSNERSGDVSVIDSSRNEVVATIPVGKRPRGIMIDADKNVLYVALSGSPITPPGTDPTSLPPADKSADGIGVIDLKLRRLIEKLPSGSDPEQFSLSADGSKMYISNEDMNTATLLDLESGQPIKTIPVGVEPEGVATTPDGRLVYVTGETTNEIHVISTDSDDVVSVFKVAERPRSVAFTPDSAKAYITCETAGIVAVVDVAASKVVKELKHEAQLVRPMGVVVSPDGSRAYVTTGRGRSVLEIDTTSDTITRVADEVGQRPWGVGITRDGRWLYTANGPSNDVSVIDTGSMKVVTRIPAGHSPWGIAIDP